MASTDPILDAVRAIPTGRVASYGTIAAMAGKPRGARQVGRTLRTLPDGHDVPWWRVINARGEITIPRSGHARPLQRALLEEEGVVFGEDGRVDMRRFGWPDGGVGRQASGVRKSSRGRASGARVRAGGTAGEGRA